MTTETWQRALSLPPYIQDHRLNVHSLEGPEQAQSTATLPFVHISQWIRVVLVEERGSTQY